MKKIDLGQKITILANVGVIVGIVFLAVEMRLNTQAIRSQTRDSITEKQMMYIGWSATSAELSAAMSKARTEGEDALTDLELGRYRSWLAGQFREWENSHYQFEQGLFSQDEYDARRVRWTRQLSESKYTSDLWKDFRMEYAPSFRAEIDRIVREVVVNRDQ